jgi:uncharacterized damage-inducible protein DinB
MITPDFVRAMAAYSAGMIADFAERQRTRVAIDARLLDWAARVDADWLSGDLLWFSGAAQREVRRPRATLVVHMFDHQAHHRGQAHAMLTAAGQQTGDTDLMLLV